ncbi:ABC transporter ATP-binding protein [Leucobacter sp. W1153]|uniref:ABC transporter ATP-binding protein n=1 Tax=unclassified Leucobacter TaxID=2621730 RepID=UPI003F3266C9
MTEPTQPDSSAADAPRPVNPSRRDRLRPLELVGFSGALAIFAALVVLLVLRTPEGVPDFAFAGIAAAIAFIVALMMVALVGLGGKPSAEDQKARKDLQSPDKNENWH